MALGLTGLPILRGKKLPQPQQLSLLVLNIESPSTPTTMFRFKSSIPSTPPVNEFVAEPHTQLIAARLRAALRRLPDEADVDNNRKWELGLATELVSYCDISRNWLMG